MNTYFQPKRLLAQSANCIQCDRYDGDMPAPGRGLRQRLALEASGSSSSSAAANPRLGAWLNEQHGRGTLHSREVAECAKAATSDACHGRDVQRLSDRAPEKMRKTSRGERVDTRNVSRDVQRAFCRANRAAGKRQLPAPYYFRAPLWDPIADSAQDGQVAMLLPHDLFGPNDRRGRGGGVLFF